MKMLIVSIGDRSLFSIIDAPTDYSDILGFEDFGAGDWTGFYDWLRDHKGTILGLRYWPFEQTNFLLSEVRGKTGVVIDPRGAVLVFFGSDTSFDEASSCDQAFEECRLLKRADGKYALAVGLSDLSNTELSTAEKRFAKIPVK